MGLDVFWKPVIQMEFFRTLQYNQSLQLKFHMDIENTPSQTICGVIFHQISAQDLVSLSSQTSLLRTPFSFTQNQSPSCQLILTPDHILFSEGTQNQLQPIAQARLCFDLKFQVLYQIQGNIRSPKIGIKLYTDENKERSFYTASSDIQLWVKGLGNRLHQKGFHERFKPLRKLGKGNFATVYEVQRLQDGKKFAVKAFSKQSCFSASKGKESLINELAVMRQLSIEPQKNLLQLEGVFQSDNSIYVVLELLEGGQLFNRIQQRNGYFTDSEVRECILGLVSGLNKMHGLRIMHRDLKPENIMLRSHFSLEPIIVDFGLASNTDQEKYLFYRCGTPGYVAPEIIALTENGHVNPECDIFSVGVIFHILLTRKPLFEGTRYEEVYKKNKEMDFKLEGQRYSQLDPLALDLLRKMLIADPAQRITAAKALEHPYFQSSEVEQKATSPCLTTASCRVKLV